jgi:hypothetical protein
LEQYGVLRWLVGDSDAHVPSVSAVDRSMDANPNRDKDIEERSA